MSHYEERLEADLDSLRRRISSIGQRVLEAQKSAVEAILGGDLALASETILGDHAVNREIRSIDKACHAFVAQHLPSAGHLRFVSSVLRLNVGLERIGDYAATLCRLAVRLSTPPPAAMVSDIRLMADQSQLVLSQALDAWDEGNAELARGTIGMARQASRAYNKTFADLLREGTQGTRPIGDLFALQVVLNRLDRVVAQAKNICEETLFTITGETKAPKVYRILFVDEGNGCESQLAAAFARKAFPQSGEYSSAGWRPQESLDPRCQLFMARHGLDPGDAKPRPLNPKREALQQYHVIVSLGGDLRPHVEEIPFHAVVLEWDLASGLEGLDQERAERLLEDIFKDIASRVRGLMETLRGKGAG